MFLPEWREFPSAPCLAKKKLMTTRVSMLLKSHASLTRFLACFLPGRAKNLSTPRYHSNHVSQPRSFVCHRRYKTSAIERFFKHKVSRTVDASDIAAYPFQIRMFENTGS